MKSGLRTFRDFFIFALFLAVCVPLLYSQEETDPGFTGRDAELITSIEILGLKRTKPHIARLPLEKFLGREGSDLDLNEVQAALRNTMTLEPLAVELVGAEDGILLRVTVQEKWSIFPIPLVMASSGGYSLGLFLADMNAFGQGDIAAAGGMYGSSGWMAMTTYQHTPSRKGLPGWGASFMYNRRENEDLDRDEKIHRRYTADRLNVSLNTNYSFTDLVSASVSASYANISLKENPDDLMAPGEGAALLGFGPGLSLHASSWDGFLLSQRSLNLGYAYSQAFSGFGFHKLNFRGVWEQPLVPGFRVNLRGGALWRTEAASRTEPFFEEGPHSAQVDILPGDFSARNYAGFSVGLEKYIYKARWGTLSALASWQGVFSYGPISGEEFDHGPSAGIRFYLSRLALPAMGFGMAYNMNSGLYQFAFSMGMGF